MEWLFLLAGLLLLTITEVYRPSVTVGVVLLATAFLLRVGRTRRLVQASGAEVAFLLLLGSGCVAAYISYKHSEAALQLTRIFALIVIFYAVRSSARPILRWVAAGFLLAATGLAVYWPTQAYWGEDEAKFTQIAVVGRWLQDHLMRLPGPRINPNVAGGALALALPFGVLLTYLFWRKRQGWAALGSGLCTLIIAAGLVLTSSRGAWLGVVAAAGLGGLALLQKLFFPATRQKWIFWGLIVLLGLAAVGGLSYLGILNRLAGTLPDPNGSFQDRPVLWKQSSSLIQDYIFTGSGLQTFKMAFSSYVLLTHIPFLDHAHNAYMEVWLEQGILGAIAVLISMAVAAGWAWRALSPAIPGEERESALDWTLLGWAGMSALATVAVHGVFDVVFYFERTLPLLGLAAGFASLLALPPKLKPAPPPWRRLLPWAAGGGLALILLALVAWFPPWQAAWQANLGALEQIRREQPAFDPENWQTLTMDEVRRTIDLSEAEAHFNLALRLDPKNLTARQRLAEIALSRGQYDQALELMEGAWQNGARDRVTRVVQGDALVAAGRIVEAAEIVRDVPWATSHLFQMAWYRYWLGVPPDPPDPQRAANTWGTILLLLPGNEFATYWRGQALQQIQP